MGSPNPVKVNKLECGVQNHCSLGFNKFAEAPVPRKLEGAEREEPSEFDKPKMKYYNKHVQVCEKNSLHTKKGYGAVSEVSLKMYFEHKYLKGKLNGQD